MNYFIFYSLTDCCFACYSRCCCCCCWVGYLPCICSQKERFKLKDGEGLLPSFFDLVNDLSSDQCLDAFGKFSLFFFSCFVRLITLSVGWVQAPAVGKSVDGWILYDCAVSLELKILQKIYIHTCGKEVWLFWSFTNLHDFDKNKLFHPALLSYSRF